MKPFSILFINLHYGIVYFFHVMATSSNNLNLTADKRYVEHRCVQTEIKCNIWNFKLTVFFCRISTVFVRIFKGFQRPLDELFSSTFVCQSVFLCACWKETGIPLERDRQKAPSSLFEQRFGMYRYEQQAETRKQTAPSKGTQRSPEADGQKERLEK